MWNYIIKWTYFIIILSCGPLYWLYNEDGFKDKCLTGLNESISKHNVVNLASIAIVYFLIWEFPQQNKME